MELVIDGRTMAVSTPSGVPVTDISLVLGDTVPVRIRVDHALTDCTPALAVKRTIGSPDLVMTVTGWTREDDWQTASWVINTVPLQAALGNADSVALVAEVVLVAPDGAQHTSRPIRMTVRRDILPAEFAPPAEVLANWEEMVAASLAAQLPDALHKAGMFVTPVDGVTTLTMSAGSNDRDFNFYTFAVNSTYISGHLAAAYNLNKITLRTPAAQNDGTRWRARLYKITSASTMQTAKLGDSTSTASWVSINSSTAECSWIFNAFPIAASDRLVIEIYAVDASGATIDKLFVAYGSAATHGGTDGVLIRPDEELTWRNYSRLIMTLEVAYTEGVSVGGVELAAKKHFDALTQDVVTNAELVHSDAAQAEAARQVAQQAAETAQQAASVIQISYANMTQSPPDGARDNYYAYGWVMVTASSGSLDTITLQPRSAGPVTDTWPVWLKVWAQDGNAWRLLGTSTNAVTQAAGTPSVWQFDGVTLDAGQRIRVDAHQAADGTAYDTRLAVRVVANTQANTGITNNQGAVSAANWMPLYTLALTTATGVTAHDIHLADQADLDAHTQDDERHVTAEDRQRWDASGGMYYADMEITADNSINGLLIPPDAPSGWYEVRVALNFTSADGRPVSVYTHSGASDPVYDWDGYMTARYAPWYKATPIPQHATREPSGLELRYDWWDASASLSDMGCILYICHKQGTASSICGVSGAPDGIANLGRIVVRQLTTQ